MAQSSVGRKGKAMPSFNVQLTVLLVTLFTGYGCQREPATYDDCVLTKLGDAKTPDAVAAVKASCRGKFPVVFDWDDLAKNAGFKTWSEVKQKPEFQALPEKEKRAAKEQYWREVLKPQVRNDFREEAHSQFISEK